MKELRKKLDYLLKTANGDKTIVKAIFDENSLSPFTVEQRLMAYLLSINRISYNDYLALGNEFSQRNQQGNQYLALFDMAPRTFGQTWGEQHILKLFPEFLKATKENLRGQYPDFDGEFDLWLDGIRVEVKACRANSTNAKGNLASRAYSHKEAKAANFKYHYQQLKPSCCDVFIWIGVCKDQLIYWILTSKELLNTGKLGSQHRNETTGIKDAKVFEGQVFMTEMELHPFLVNEKDILLKVKEKGQKI